MRLFLISFLMVASLGNTFGQPRKKKSEEFIVEITTRFGKIGLILFQDTPAHRENFLKLATERFYDSTMFHRVLKDFVVQGGDPESRPGGDTTKIGNGGPGYTIPAEFVKQYTHKKGMLAAARKGDDLNPEKQSSGSHFYIVQNENGAHHLDGAYTIFGKVLYGIDVVDMIADQPVSRKGFPEQPIYMTMKVLRRKKKDILRQFNYQVPN